MQTWTPPWHSITSSLGKSKPLAWLGDTITTLYLSLYSLVKHSRTVTTLAGSSAEMSSTLMPAFPNFLLTCSCLDSMTMIVGHYPATFTHSATIAFSQLLTSLYTAITLLLKDICSLLGRVKSKKVPSQFSLMRFLCQASNIEPLKAQIF